MFGHFKQATAVELDGDDCERWSYQVTSNIGGYRRRVNPWLYIVQLLHDVYFWRPIIQQHYV
jgi:hypothetical protein